MNKVSCVMPTYRRFTCVERSIACFLSQQTELETELIICNTDVDNPLELDDTFSLEDKNKIKIYNSNIDLETSNQYNSTGAIRRDGVSRSTGNLYITWDDDDIFLPWNIQQCYNGLIRTQARAWKPHKSIMWWREHPTLEHNFLEATIMMYIEEAIFTQNSGLENLNWYNRLEQNKTLVSDTYSIPAYCYYWKDPKEIGGHKQGNAEDIEKPNNFQIHMENSKDTATRLLTKRNIRDYKLILKDLGKFFTDSEHKDLVVKYVDMNIFD